MMWALTLLATASLCGGQVFDVTGFGAMGDGETDDRPSIQAAIDTASSYAGEHGEATVYFPAGRYKVVVPGTVIGTLWLKESSEWVKQGELLDGTALAGWTCTLDAPAGSPLPGSELVLDLRTGRVFAPSGGTWEEAGHLLDKAGPGWLAGHADPDPAEGEDGTVYLKFTLRWDHLNASVFNLRSENSGLTFEGVSHADSVLSLYAWGDVHPMDYAVDKATQTVLTTRLVQDTTGTIWQHYKRGTLFHIDPLNDRFGFITGINFVNLGMDGNTTPNGKHGFYTPYQSLEEWDMSHKAIVFGFGGVDMGRFQIRGCALYGWRGEIVYKGGLNNAEVLIQDTQIYNSNSSAVSMGAQLTVENCEIWDVVNGFENFNYPGQYTIVRNNRIQLRRHLPKTYQGYGVVYIGKEGAFCEITGNTISDGEAAVFLSEFCSDVSIVSNEIIDNQWGVYAIHLNQYGMSPFWKNILVSDNSFIASSRDMKYALRGFLGTQPVENLVIDGNRAYGMNGFKVNVFSGIRHDGPRESLVNYVLRNNLIEGAHLNADGSFLPEMYGNTVSGNNGTFHMSYHQDPTTPMKLSFQWQRAELEHIEADGRDIELYRTDIYYPGFEVSLKRRFSSANMKGAEIKPDPRWNTLERGYFLYSGKAGNDAITLRFNDDGKFDLVEFSQRGDGPFTVTEGDSINALGYESVTLAPAMETSYTRHMGIGEAYPVTVHLNEHVRFADSPTIDVPGEGTFTPPHGVTCLEVKKLNEVLGFLPQAYDTLSPETVTAGEVARLEVKAFGTEPMAIDWFFGEVGDESQPIGQTGASIEVVAGEADFTAWARLSNPYGSRLSAPVRVQVIPQAGSTPDEEPTNTGNPALPSHEAPAAPQFQKILPKLDSIFLRWSCVDSPVDYELQMASVGGDYVQVAVYNSASNGVVLSGLLPSTHYQFRLRALRGELASEWASTALVTTLPAQLPSEPEPEPQPQPEPEPEPVAPDAPTLGWEILDHETVAISWTADAAVDGYELELTDEAGTTQHTATLGPDESTLELTGLSPEATYLVRLRSLRDGLVSEWASGEALTLPEAPLRPFHFWNFDATEEGQFVDWGTCGSSLSLGDLTTAPGISGDALRLNGAHSGLTIPDCGPLANAITGKLTLALWIKPDVAALHRTSVLYEQGGFWRGLNVILDKGWISATGWNRPAQESDWQGTTLSGGKLLIGEWNHVALVLDAGETVLPEAFRLYVNGALVATGEASQLWPHGGSNGLGQVNGSTVYLGREIRQMDPIQGTIDDLCLWGEAFEAATIEELILFGTQG